MVSGSSDHEIQDLRVGLAAGHDLAWKAKDSVSQSNQYQLEVSGCIHAHLSGGEKAWTFSTTNDADVSPLARRRFPTVRLASVPMLYLADHL